MADYIPRWFARPKMVPHPSTNRPRRRVTSLIRLTPSPLRRTPIITAAGLYTSPPQKKSQLPSLRTPRVLTARVHGEASMNTRPTLTACVEKKHCFGPTRPVDMGSLSTLPVFTGRLTGCRHGPRTRASTDTRVGKLGHRVLTGCVHGRRF